MPTTDKAAMKQRVFEQAEAANVRFVSLQFTDIMGVVKNVHIPFHKFGDAVENGLWFDGSSIEGFARIHESDMFLDPDLETFGIIPWERREESSTARRASAERDDIRAIKASSDFVATREQILGLIWATAGEG